MTSYAEIAGWNTLDQFGVPKDKALSSKDRERQDQVALFGAVFGSEAGRKVLAILIHETLDRPMIPEAVNAQVPITFDQMAPYVTFRQGQNAIVKLICDILAEAERGPAKPRGK